MPKISNYYAMRCLKCIHLIATVLWCGGAAALILLNHTSGLSVEAASMLSVYFVRPGVFCLVMTGLIYTLFTNFTCKQRWIRAKWLITLATAFSGMIILSAAFESVVKVILMITLIIVSVYHVPKNKHA